MSEHMDSERQGYCTNCGAEIRPGNAYCVSCGAPLTTGARQPGADEAGPGPPGRSGDPAGGFGRGLRGMPYRARRWFGGLPLSGQAALAGLVLLALFTVLSPVAYIIA